MRILFVAGGAIGHLNPMLVLAKAAVKQGHEVHFQNMESVRTRIEDTGARFHSSVDVQPEFYEGRNMSGPLGAIDDLLEEHELEKSSFLSMLKILNVMLEKQLPGSIRLLSALQPDLVVYDPLIQAREAMFAAKILHIPAVGVWTLAGPGAYVTHSVTTMLPLTLADAHSHIVAFQPNADATKRLNTSYGLTLSPGLPEPAGKVDFCGSNTILVTTSADLQDPITDDLVRSYEDDGVNFVFVGPLLAQNNGAGDDSEDEAVRRVRVAKRQGRPVVLISMGTLLVSDHSLNGWEGRSGSSSLTGRELCHGVWAGVFDAFGSNAIDEGALIVLSLGPRPNPLEMLHAPPNAFCMPFLSQQAVLNAGVDLFLTHGGQNSFTEAMIYGTPVVVCPGFGDQIVNSRKADALGVGLKVDRPQGAPDSSGEVATQYRSDVYQALLAVYAKKEQFQAAAQACKARLERAGGLNVAMNTLESVAKAGSNSSSAKRSERLQALTPVARPGGA